MRDLLQTDQPKVFNSMTHGQLTEEEMILFMKLFLEAKPNQEYSIVIGTDSEEHANDSKENKYVHLVTAIVVYRKGYGGIYFWKKKIDNNIHSLRQKIYAETLTSLEFAIDFVPKFQSALNGQRPNYNLEIHIDVGEHGATRDMIKEVVGMVTGNGFIAKTKPFSYGASNVADKHT